MLQSESGSGLAEGQSEAYGAECEGEGFNQYRASQVCQQIFVCVCVCAVPAEGDKVTVMKSYFVCRRKARSPCMHPPPTHTHTHTFFLQLLLIIPHHTHALILLQ